MYLLRISFNGTPFILEVEVSGELAHVKREICNPYNKLYDERYKFDKSWVIKSNKEAPKTTQIGHALYSEDLSVLQKVVIDYILRE